MSEGTVKILKKVLCNLDNKSSTMPKVITVLNMKGEVGKTTLSVNLAYIFSTLGSLCCSLLLIHVTVLSIFSYQILK